MAFVEFQIWSWIYGFTFPVNVCVFFKLVCKRLCHLFCFCGYISSNVFSVIIYSLVYGIPLAVIKTDFKNVFSKDSFFQNWPAIF